MDDPTLDAFLRRWSASGGGELANSQSFLNELCDFLEVDRPDPTVPDEPTNAYVFEKAVVFDNLDGTHTTRRIDLYRRGAFICETKQGVERDDREFLSERASEAQRRRRAGHGQRGTRAYDDTMLRARSQAEQYARNLPAEEGRPPILMVIDVGHSIELYAEFTQTGGVYTPFPDPLTHRIKLADLADPDVRERLRLVWTDPQALDPAKRSAKVTRDIAAKLAELAKSLEKSGHEPEDVAQFLMRCLFTMFAEDVGLLDRDSFKKLLKDIDDIAGFVPTLQELWGRMNIGGFSVSLKKVVKRFNGGLFAESQALPLTRDQLDLLIEAAEKSWNDVEPAIFGTLLERALDPVERHKLGAHYTPRAYVERLVIPTVVEPLREEWDAARTAAVTLAKSGDTAGAVAELERFHNRLCEVKVLDPACGSGNFLYVTLEHLKRLEGEIFTVYESIAHRQMTFEESHTVDPHQLLGIEVNPRAAVIAELVLWIGYLQWHYRTRGKVAPPEPVIKNFKNIRPGDALISYDSKEIVCDDSGRPIFIWDGRTTKTDPVSGLEVPDESARVPMYRYVNAKEEAWPDADYIIGNPPYVGEKKMRHDLGDSYVDTVRSAYPSLPGNIDFVMYWWAKAAHLVSTGKTKRSGLITTKTIAQETNRPIVASFLASHPQAGVAFAIPNHPWIDNSLCAAVRVAMTVVHREGRQGTRAEVIGEVAEEDSTAVELEERVGDLHADLRVGIDIRKAKPLQSNKDLCLQGIKLVAPRKGPGFGISKQERDAYLAISSRYERFLPLYLAGKDVTERVRYRYLIDFFGIDETESRRSFPEGYQRCLTYLKPFRARNSMRSRREKWWQLGVNAPKLRIAMEGIDRIILTSEVAEYRTFSFYETHGMLPDGALAAIPSDDAFILGVLSSRISLVWAHHAGGRMGAGDTPRYQNGPCFDPFPFPVHSEASSRIRQIAEALDSHRKRQLALHTSLIMTEVYRVLRKICNGESLTEDDKSINEQGLVSVLKQIHDDLDAAVAEAYGWPVDLADEEILERLVALNHERAAEEARGVIRWLRPEFQNPDGKTQRRAAGLDADDEEADEKKPAKAAKAKKLPWPKSLADQAAALQAALVACKSPATADEVAAKFLNSKKNADRIEELLDALVSLGRARELQDGRFLAV